MAIYRFQVAALCDSLLPRDAIVNTLYYSRILDTGDDDGLCLDIANAFDDFWYSSLHPPITVKQYDVGSGPSGPPRGEASINGSSVTPTNFPREVALCLSFWADQRANPRRRGRIFLHAGGHGSSHGVRPSSTIITDALNLGDALAGIGGADVSWQVYSPTDQDSFDVTNTWVDDEWDTIRSRGLRNTSRESRGV